MSLNHPTVRRRAFVTGASRGIGRASALALARDGWDLVISARTIEEGTGSALPSSRSRAAELGEVALPGSLQATAAAARDLGAEVESIAMNLLDRAAVEAAAADVVTSGPLHGVVLAGIYQGPGNLDPFLDLDIADAERIINGNYLHQLVLLQQLVPALIASGGGPVVNITSFSARFDPPKPAGKGGWGMAYGASKAAMHRVAGHLHVEFADRGIRAYNVDPGMVVNEMAKATGSNMTSTGQPPEPIGDVVAWLCSDSPTAAELAGTLVIADKVLAAGYLRS